MKRTRRKLNSFSNAVKFYNGTFPNPNRPMDVSLVIGRNNDSSTIVKITIVYWDNGRKIVKKDFLATGDTSIDFTINNPSSVPPYILYLEQSPFDMATDVFIDVNSDIPLEDYGKIGENDYDIMNPDEYMKSPSFSFGEIKMLAYPSVIPTLKENFDKGEASTSPLVIDLDGDGVVETIGLDNGVYFDHDNNGFAEGSAWVGRDDGVLVRDINNNGQVDGGYELFGNNTKLSNGETAANGFEALADLDTNQDGIFDADDDAWNEVKVWQDKNGNGVIDNGEILTLEDAGVSGINLDYSNSEYVDENGNAHKQVGSFVDSNGNTKQINDVWFEVDKSDTRYELDIEISEDISKLPNIQGFGNVYSLHEAMALDETGELKALVEQFVNETDYSVKQNLLLDIIYHWTGVQDIDPESRAATQIYGNEIGDARKLEALEEFLGEEFVGTWCGGEKDSNPHGVAAPYLLQAFEDLKSYIYASLIHGEYTDFLDGIAFDWNAQTKSWDIDTTDFVEQLRGLYNYDDESFSHLLNTLSSIIRLYGDVGESVIEHIRYTFKDSYYGLERALMTFGANGNIGSEGDDILYGTDNSDIIYGLDGDDNVIGGKGNDVIIGGQGNDWLNGDEGSDTYVWNLGDGFDTINDYEYTNYGEEIPQDRILFGEGVSFSDLTFKSHFGDLYIYVNGDETQGMMIKNYYYNPDNRIEKLDFADGTSVNLYETSLTYNQSDESEAIYTNNEDSIIYANGGNDSIYAGDGNDTIYGGDGDDTIYTGKGNNTVIGGKGNDIIYGGEGSDTYVWNLGDGLDTINDSNYSDEPSNDKIVFGEGISFEDLTFRGVSGALQIIVNGDETQGIIIGGFIFYSNKLRVLEFSDGSCVNLNEISITYNQSDENESIYTNNSDSIVYANGGDDYVYTGSGNDIIYGGEGNDYLSGGSGNDTLVGGQGDDWLLGGEGSDTYVWNLGDGFDTIEENIYWESGEKEDKVIFGKDISFENLTFEVVGFDLNIYVNGNEMQGMKLKDYFCNPDKSIDKLEFEDGTTVDLKTLDLTYYMTDNNDTVLTNNGNSIVYANGGNDYVYTGSGNDTIYGGEGNDNLQGGDGDDTYVYRLGDGMDTIYDTEGNDKIIFDGISINDVTMSQDGGNLVIKINGDDTSGVTILNHGAGYGPNAIETIEFTDGSIYTYTDGAFQASQLVQAIASFNAASSSNTEIKIDDPIGFEPVIGVFENKNVA